MEKFSYIKHNISGYNEKEKLIYQDIQVYYTHEKVPLDCRGFRVSETKNNDTKE